MICKIADLTVEVPEAGDLVPRCRTYLSHETAGADIVLRTDLFNHEGWENVPETRRIYMLSGSYFYRDLLAYNGMMLHASAVALDGRAYLFSAPCGTGKSTHTQLWRSVFGEKAVVFNDDKPALRRLDGRWFAYGTPWCGKDGINVNCKVPLAGICFLKQAQKNKIRRLTPLEAAQNLISQTLHNFRQTENMDRMLTLVDSLVREIPVFELENRPESAAVTLSYETMRRAAEETFL